MSIYLGSIRLLLCIFETFLILHLVVAFYWEFHGGKMYHMYSGELPIKMIGTGGDYIHKIFICILYD